MEYKTYVSVTVHFTAQGRMIPSSIEWEDGRVYEIDKILDVDVYKRQPLFVQSGEVTVSHSPISWPRAESVCVRVSAAPQPLSQFAVSVPSWVQVLSLIHISTW